MNKQHQKSMQTVIRFLESHLDQSVTVTELAEHANYSSFHFQRIFKSFTGESIYAYRKRLLLERAFGRIKFSDSSLISIAHQASYADQSAFNKAFKKNFGATPSVVREGGYEMRKEYQRQIANTTELKVELVKKEQLNLISIREVGNGYEDAAAKAWSRLMEFANKHALIDTRTKYFGISHDDPDITASEKIRYDACLQVNMNVGIPVTNGIMRTQIKAGSYAKVQHKGDYARFSETFAYLFNHWLPTSGYALCDEPCFVEYLTPYLMHNPESLRSELYVPLK